MIPLWKIKRELLRSGQQVQGLFDKVTDPVRQRSLDRKVAAGLPCLTGVLPASNKIALMLVYQPSGISVFGTCVSQTIYLRISDKGVRNSHE